ncbi:galactose-1-phosphate uridylyltransferase [Rhodococcus rhodochrous]|uniref:Galactose-1-phosphate uridylyltransferase n=1 Tax=Rhodococcus rhodochrous TaxID=1829 RepID=A0AAW4XJN4_RHORH|nr:galactose-1-phosphate uridylyltransferase [Rhodococcus rhodochrous]MCD2112870.1 galactose-1-phosphate uridylyltransferase [Rhodococcus rhodochrous]
MGARVRQTVTHLADGRELIYFDDTEPFVSGAATRDLHDRRDLPPVAATSEMRRDPLTGEWVTFAAHRMERTFLPSAVDCPLCPSRADACTEIPADDYDVVVFENRFPSLGAPSSDEDLVDDDGLWPRRPATGRCEVVAFTPDHDARFADLSVSRARTVIDALAARAAELSQLPDVEQVFCFENRGVEIGVTLQHPHGQIYAYPFVPPRSQALLDRAREHRRRTGRSLQGDILDAERRAGTRLVFSGDAWSAYVPAAARWPVEVHLVPHRDVAGLAALDEHERDELARLQRDLLGRVDRFFPGVDRAPYIAAWHQAPVGAPHGDVRLFCQIFSLRRAPDKLKYLAGSESAMGAWISDTTPERIAERLREVAP